jgi:hypothetical protein
MVSPTILHLLLSLRTKPIREQQQGEMPILTLLHPAFAQRFMVLGNPLALRAAESSWDRVVRREASATSAPPRGQRTVPADLTVADRDGMPGAYFRYHQHQPSLASE